MKALIRRYEGYMKAVRRCEGYMKAVLRLYEDYMKTVLRLYEACIKECMTSPRDAHIPHHGPVSGKCTARTSRGCLRMAPRPSDPLGL